MTEILLQFGFLALSITGVIICADLLIENAEKMAKYFKVPSFLIGVLVLAVGTSLPELSTSISASLVGETDVVVSNVLGSNIANVFLGLGLLALVTRKSIDFKQNVFEVHFPMVMMSVVATVLFLYDDQVVSTGEGILYLVMLAAYIWFLVSRGNFEAKEAKKDAVEEDRKFSWKSLGFLIVGLGGLIFSSKFVVDSLLNISDIMGIAKSALSASLVAIGTSLPELAVGFSAIKKGNTEMLIGNIIGSNIFNVLLILGIGSLISPLEAGEQTMKVILPFFVGSIFVYWISKTDKKITVQEGAGMVVLYVAFLGKLYGFL